MASTIPSIHTNTSIQSYQTLLCGFLSLSLPDLLTVIFQFNTTSSALTARAQDSCTVQPSSEEMFDTINEGHSFTHMAKQLMALFFTMAKQSIGIVLHYMLIYHLVSSTCII